MPLVQFNLNFVPGVQSLFQQLLFAARAHIWPSPAYSNPMAKNKRMKNKCATRVLTLVSLYHNFFCVLELETQFHDPLRGPFLFTTPTCCLYVPPTIVTFIYAKARKKWSKSGKTKLQFKTSQQLYHLPACSTRNFDRFAGATFWLTCEQLSCLSQPYWRLTMMTLQWRQFHNLLSNFVSLFVMTAAEQQIIWQIKLNYKHYTLTFRTY